VTAGYSGTPLLHKLGIREGHAVAVLRAPADFAATLGALPGGVTMRRALGAGALDVIIAFVKRRSELERDVAAARKRMAGAASLWIAWPKRSSGVATDVTENLLREVILPTGLVDNKVCAIDETWSGLRFVIRKQLR
jgi:hypothetical protein